MKSQHQDEYKKHIQALVQARKDAGVTQEALAVKLRKHQSFVSKYETYERRLDVLEFVKISKLIGADYKKLIDEALG